MLEAARARRTISDSDYEARVPALREALVVAQHRMRMEEAFSLVVVVAGDDWRGCNALVNRLHEWMDARYLGLHATERPTDEERAYPWIRRFFGPLPARGATTVFLGGWALQEIVAQVRDEGRRGARAARLDRLRRFELGLVENDTRLLKVWLHLSGPEVDERGRQSLSEVTIEPDDDAAFADRRAVLEVAEEVLAETHTRSCPWIVVPSGDSRYRDVTVAEHVLETLERTPREERAVGSTVPASGVLGSADLERRLARDAYDRELDRWQERLREANWSARRSGVGSIVVLEGWDAAGKGGVLRRMTRAMDARNYRVHAVSAPTDEESARPWLWRFWRRIPRAGRMALFDRSWYGRVLVERVEGFATTPQWSRAYEEILAFEESLVDAGYVLLKFFLHIDRDEQLRRFRRREETPFKRFKITPEDWRNRRRWPDYETAIEEMAARTGTDRAPWRVVPFNDKPYGRIEVIRAVVEALEAAHDHPAERDAAGPS